MVSELDCRTPAGVAEFLDVENRRVWCQKSCDCGGYLRAKEKHTEGVFFPTSPPSPLLLVTWKLCVGMAVSQDGEIEDF